MTAETLLGERGQWVGPPVLVLALRLQREEMILDGRKRAKEHEARGLARDYAIPRLVIHSHLEAVQQLILAGHHDRAAFHCLEHAPHLRNQSVHALAQIMRVSRQRLIPFREAVKNPSERHKAPRRTLRVLQRAKKIRQMHIEGAPLTLADLDWVLDGFLDDD